MRQAAARSAAPAIMASLPPAGGSVVIAPVMSLAADAGDGAAGGGGPAIRALSSVFGAEELFDCFSTGVGEIIKGAAGIAGVAGLAAVLRGRGSLRWRGRLAGLFHRRQLRRAAGVEQRHRHLEGAEHDHDHARADQQRADLGGHVRGGLVAALSRPWPCRRPCPWARPSRAPGFLGGRRGGRGLRGAARGGNEARRADRLLRRGGDFADRVFGSRDPFRRRRHARRSAACPARADDPAAIPARSRCAARRHAAPGFR